MRERERYDTESLTVVFFYYLPHTASHESGFGVHGQAQLHSADEHAICNTLSSTTLPRRDGGPRILLGMIPTPFCSVSFSLPDCLRLQKSIRHLAEPATNTQPKKQAKKNTEKITCWEDR